MKDKKTFESYDSDDNSKYSNKKYDESDYNTDYTGKLLADHYLEKVRKEHEKETNTKNEETKRQSEYQNIEKEKPNTKTIPSQNKVKRNNVNNKDTEKPIYSQWRFWVLLIFALVIWYSFGFN